MASRSIGKAWQRGNGKSLETRCVEGLLVSLCSMCVLAIFDGCQKTVLVSVRAYTKLSTFSAPITMALTKKRKATALEEDATPVKSGYSGQALIATRRREKRRRYLMKSMTQQTLPSESSAPAHSNKRKSKAVVDDFGPKYEDAHLAVSASTTLYLPACRIGCLA